MLEINLNMYHAVALAASLYWLGSFLCEKVPLFGRYCIPAPLVGGVCFAAVNTALYATGTAFISFDDTLQVVFMNIFFTTVGFTVSLQQLKRGGKAVFLCLILAIIITCGRTCSASSPSARSARTRGSASARGRLR